MHKNLRQPHIKLNNEYHIGDLSLMRFVRGDNFCYGDLYELVGKHQFTTTFHFKEGSPSFAKFGQSVVGFMSCSHTEANEPINRSNSKNTNQDKKLRITPYRSEDLSTEKKEDLKYGGIDICDIEKIVPFIYKEEPRFHETGEKKVLGVVEIKLSTEQLKGVDYNALFQWFLINKNHEGVQLTYFEKEELIGVILALNGGRINPIELKDLGFNEDSMNLNLNIHDYYYCAKERQGTLSDAEKRIHAKIKLIKDVNIILKLINELDKSNASMAERRSIITPVFMDQFTSFKPRVLLLGKKQVFWDVESYIHITMRHVKKYQLGNFRKDKTPLPYRVKDLTSLIKSVLGRIKDEYEVHSLNKPEARFFRKGNMAVEFNGDHYSLQILPDGRLDQFHSN